MQNSGNKKFIMITQDKSYTLLMQLFFYPDAIAVDIKRYWNIADN